MMDRMGPYASYDDGGAFERVCPKCGRFVKADPSIKVNEETGLMPGPTGTCKVHGRIEMPFLGFL